MIGAEGLGLVVLGLGRLDVGRAAVGGIAIVLLAMVLDRITQQLATPKSGRPAERGALLHGRPCVSRRGRPDETVPVVTRAKEAL
ncbi:MAG: hypothetical protein KIT76_08140 [Pseudolabrys sp.]|nr:hypothetical protein [Pseudolabrys sp.]